MCTLIGHKDHNNNIKVYSVTVMAHAIALEPGQSSQRTFEPIISAIHTKGYPQTFPFLISSSLTECSNILIGYIASFDRN